MRYVYVCDVKKNTKCSKTGCHINGWDCWRTFNPEYAYLNENGEPIICDEVPDNDGFDEDFEHEEKP